MILSDKKLQDLIGWEPHTGQKAIIDCDKRDIAICAGRRWGKSAVSAYIVLKTFLNGLVEIKQGERDSLKIFIVAPSYELTQKVFEYLIKWILKIYPEFHSNIQNRPFPQIKVAEGVWVQCKSTENPSSILGEEVDLIVLDEAAQVSKRVYEQYIVPTTSSRKGRSIFISTPFGQNWFYNKFMWCKERGGAFQFKSIDGVSVDKEEWERTKQMLPSQVFAQEYEASFLPDAAAVFRGVNEIIKDNAEQDAAPNHRYVMGVDLAKHEDFTCLTIIDKHNNNVVYWDRFKDIEYPFQKARIKATAQRYNNARIIVDSTGVGEPIREDLAREGLFVDDFKFTNRSKKELIEKLSIFIEQKNVFIPNREPLVDELNTFGYHLSDSGNVIYRAPEGLHDDCVISLALAVWGLMGRAVPLTAVQEELKRLKKYKQKDNFF